MGEFIEQKTASYIEPERKGTAKGDEIGFSRKKHEAAVYNITKLKIKYLAFIIAISYGLLRKWRTEEKFKEMIKKYSRQFAECFCGYIDKLVEEESEKINKLSDEEYEIYLAECQHRLSDGDLYGPQICAEVQRILEMRIAEIDHRRKQGASGPKDDIYLVMLERALNWSNIDLKPKSGLLKQITDDIKRRRREQLDRDKERGATIIDQDPIELFKKVLAHENLTDKDREQAIQLLEVELELLKHGYRFFKSEDYE